MRLPFLSLIALCAGCVRPPVTQTPPSAAPDATVREVATYRSLLASGDSMQVTIREVSYPPGGTSASHRHPCAVVGYVLEGQVRFAVGDAPERVLGPGATFHEFPGEEHRVSANASRTEPTRFLATFICPITPAGAR